MGLSISVSRASVKPETGEGLQTSPRIADPGAGPGKMSAGLEPSS